MRTRLIVAVVVTVLLAGVMAYGAIGSGAWFTDTETVAGKPVTTGTLNIGVTSELADIVNLEPGGAAKSAGVLGVKNDGSLPLKFQAWLVPQANPEEIDDHLTVTCILNPVPGDTYGPGSPTTIFQDIPIEWLYAHDNPYLRLTEGPGTIPMAPGMVAHWEFKVKMTKNAEDVHQGDSYRANVVIWATQAINADDADGDGVFWEGRP